MQLKWLGGQPDSALAKVGVVGSNPIARFQEFFRDWTQLRTNGPLLIPTKSIVAYKRELIDHGARVAATIPSGVK